MCDATAAILAPRIHSLFEREGASRTGEEILASLRAGGLLCEAHAPALDMALRRLLREGRLRTDSGPAALDLDPDELRRLAFVPGTPTGPLGPGSIVDGRLEILEEIGRGGMGVVFRARHLNLEKDVALKVLSPTMLHPSVEFQEALERFRREARAIAKLSHPHILHVYDLGQEGEFIYYVMELLGETLAQRIDREGPLPWATVLETMLHMAEALKAAHDQNIRHRDVKPANILYPGPRLADFGLAQVLPAPGSAADYRSLTRQRTLIGTVQYMAPEVANLEEGDHRSDQYSLGASMVEALTGRPLFDIPPGPSHQLEWMYHQVNEKHTPILDLRPDCPREFAEAVERTLAKSPDLRYQNWGALVNHLRKLLSKLPQPAAPASTRIPTSGRGPSMTQATSTESGPARPRPAGTTIVSRFLGAIDLEAVMLTSTYEERFGAGCFSVNLPFMKALGELARRKAILRLLGRIAAREAGVDQISDFEDRYLSEIDTLTAGQEIPATARPLNLDLRDYLWMVTRHGTEDKAKGSLPDLSSAEAVLKFLQEAIDDPSLQVHRVPEPAVLPTPPAVPSPTSGPSSPAITRIRWASERRKILGELRSRVHQITSRWHERFGHNCFEHGAPEFLTDLWETAKERGMVPLMRAVVEREKGQPCDRFADLYEQALLAVAKGTAPDQALLQAGIEIPFTRYLWRDVEFADQELRQEREPNPSIARAMVAFLEEAFDHPRLESYRVPQFPPAPAAPERAYATAAVFRTEDLIGRKLGPYRVQRFIGKGGMAAVYEAHDENLERLVALKVLFPHHAQDEDYVKRFLREAKAASKFQHPNVVHVYSAELEGALLWIVMELVRGQTLRQLLDARGTPLETHEALRIARQAAEGLFAAHEAGLIHRDIKPDNLMVDPDGRLRIMDFGLVKAHLKEKGATATTKDLFLGTPKYASPEQCRAEDLDPRTDIYSLGVTLYELLSGALPYVARKTSAFLKIVPDPKIPPVPLREKNPRVPPEVEDLVEWMIAKDPDDRPANATEVINRIDEIIEKIESGKQARRPRKRAFFAAGVLALLAALVIYYFWPGKREPSSPSEIARPNISEPVDTPEPPKPPPSAPSKPSIEAPVLAKPELPEPEPLPTKTPEVQPPGSGGPIPLSPGSIIDGRLEILTHHKPTEDEIKILDKLLALSRSSLPRRASYSFDQALSQLAAFRKEETLTPWTTIFVEAERERIEAAARAWKTAPLLKPDVVHALTLRDGRTLKGRSLGVAADQIRLELTTGFRETVPVDLVAPVSFPAAAAPSFEGLLLRSAAGDALGVLPRLSETEATDRRRYLPLLVDQAVEEALLAVSRRKDVKPLLALDLSESLRTTLGAVAPARLQLYDTEKEAARLYAMRGEKDALARLLLELADTRAGGLAAQETLTAFQKELAEAWEKSQASEETKYDLELVGSIPWGVWTKDSKSVPGAAITPDFKNDTFTLSSPDPIERVRLLKKMSGARKGYAIKWRLGPTSGDSTTLMLALSFHRWFDLTPREVQLFRRDKDPVSSDEKIGLAKKVDLPAPVRAGTIHVVPRPSLVLVYLGERLLFTLKEEDWALGEGLQIGAGGGAVILESLRVLERTAD